MRSFSDDLLPNNLLYYNKTFKENLEMLSEYNS